jgi:hypothetical protein
MEVLVLAAALMLSAGISLGAARALLGASVLLMSHADARQPAVEPIDG